VPRLPLRVLLFLSSYAPLFWILAYRNRHDTAAWIVLVATGVLAALGLLAVMLSYRGAEGVAITIAHCKPRDAEVLSYVAGYLIPFFGLDLSKTDDRVTLIAFLVVLGVVYVNSSLLLVNPLLSLARYRAWDIEDSDGHEYLLVTREIPKPKDVVKPIKVGEYLRVKV
jgi:hypothetical protein